MVPNRVGELENEIALLKLAYMALYGRLADCQNALAECQTMLAEAGLAFVDSPEKAAFPARALMQRKQNIGLHG